MAELKNVRKMGSQMLVTMDDGTKFTAYPTTIGLWIAIGNAGPGPGPGPGDDQFVYPFTLDAVAPGNGYQTPSRPSHEGIDFSNGIVNEGDEIRASANGIVAWHEQYHSGWGNVVRLEHNVSGHGTVSTLYAHMIRNSEVVTVGQTVVQGQKLGLVGNTGNSFGAHLHYETWEGTVYGTHRDPIGALPDWNGA